MIFVFFAPELNKYRHVDYCKCFKTVDAARKYIKKDCVAMRKVYPGEEWLERNYFIARRA